MKLNENTSSKGTWSLSLMSTQYAKDKGGYFHKALLIFLTTLQGEGA